MVVGPGACLKESAIFRAMMARRILRFLKLSEVRIGRWCFGYKTGAYCSIRAHASQRKKKRHCSRGRAASSAHETAGSIERMLHNLEDASPCYALGSELHSSHRYAAFGPATGGTLYLSFVCVFHQAIFSFSTRYKHFPFSCHHASPKQHTVNLHASVDCLFSHGSTGLQT